MKFLPSPPRHLLNIPAKHHLLLLGVRLDSVDNNLLLQPTTLYSFIVLMIAVSGNLLNFFRMTLVLYVV
jgi:hypothetical protein